MQDNLPTQQPQSPTPIAAPSTRPRHRSGMYVFVLTAILLITIIVGYSTYKLGSNKATTKVATLQSELSTQSKQLDALKKKLADQPSTTNQTPVTANNLVVINELGVSLTVPDNLKDLYYTSKVEGDALSSTVAYFSTHSLQTADISCSALGNAPPLGRLSKTFGKYPSNPTIGNSTGTLVKQFDDYYIAFTSPQAPCSESSSTENLAASSRDAFKTSFSSIKEIK